MTWHYPRSRVVRVIDGDTFVADVDIGFDLRLTREVRVRGINCPELRGASAQAGQSARAFATALIDDTTVTIVSAKWDKYRRIEADVTLADGRDLGNVLVEAGHAKRAKA